jgi:hypothetical protein
MVGVYRREVTMSDDVIRGDGTPSHSRLPPKAPPKGVRPPQLEGKRGIRSGAIKFPNMAAILRWVHKRVGSNPEDDYKLTPKWPEAMFWLKWARRHLGEFAKLMLAMQRKVEEEEKARQEETGELDGLITQLKADWLKSDARRAALAAEQAAGRVVIRPETRMPPEDS